MVALDSLLTETGTEHGMWQQSAETQAGSGEPFWQLIQLVIFGYLLASLEV